MNSLDVEFKELAKILSPEVLDDLKDKLTRLYQRVEDLEMSRDNWKRQFLELQAKKG